LTPTAFWSRSRPSKRLARRPPSTVVTRPEADSRPILILHARRGIIARMKDRLAKRRRTLFWAILMIAHSMYCACPAPRQIAMKTPDGRIQNYPPVIEDTPQRRQADLEAWKKLIAEFQLPEMKLDLEPVLSTPRSLPPETAGRISLQSKGGAFGELEA